MAKRKLVITDPARNDLTDIRTYTTNTHGPDIADAYDVLMKQAFKDLVDDPFRHGSKDRPEINEGIRTYHVSLSRSRAASRIKRPRHFVLYFLPKEDELVISRVLHDSRDLARHLPNEHRRVMERAQALKRRRPSRGKSRER